ncbi:MAG: MFS transporter, partial [Kiloniellales bacterium]|nr:MFS transporter [Kiloniellales bacterium]
MLCILATYAFGNYLFAALLPNMQVSIGFDYSAAGLITSMGMVAFLAGSLVSARLCVVIGPENLVILTMLVTAGALFGYSLAGDYWTLLVLRTIIGVATATAWVPMAVLVPRFTPPSFRGRAMGFVNAGTNFGLILNGLLLSLLLMPIGSGGLWIVTGLISLSIAVGCMIVFRRADGFQPGTMAKSSGGSPRRRTEAGGSRSRSGMALVLVCASIVALLGAPLLTYLSAYAVDDLGYRSSQIAPIWSMMGIAGALGGVVLGWIADKHTVRTAIVMAFTLLGATAA